MKCLCFNPEIAIFKPYSYSIDFKSQLLFIFSALIFALFYGPIRKKNIIFEIDVYHYKMPIIFQNCQKKIIPAILVCSLDKINENWYVYIMFDLNVVGKKDH